MTDILAVLDTLLLAAVAGLAVVLLGTAGDVIARAVSRRRPTSPRRHP